MLEAAFSLDIEFYILWVSRFVDNSFADKAKRLRELTLQALTAVKVGETDYLKALKSYLRGCKLKYAYILSL